MSRPAVELVDQPRRIVRRHYPGRRNRRVHRTNFGGSIPLPTAIRPHTTEELLDVLRSRRPHSVMVIGEGGSWSNVLVPESSETLMLDLALLEGEIRLDLDRLEVTAPASMTAEQLFRFLDEYRLQIENVPTYDQCTLGGLIATGSHGSSRSGGYLHRSVVGLHLVDAAGRAFLLDEDGLVEVASGQRRLAGSKYLEHGVVHLGGLGVVTEITFRVVPEQYLRQTQVFYDEAAMLSDACAGLRLHLASHDHASMAWAINQRRCCARGARTVPTSCGSRELQSGLERWFTTFLPTWLFRLVHRLPFLAGPVITLLLRPFFTRSVVEGLSWQVQTYNPARLKRGTPFASMEYAVPLVRLPELVSVVERRLRGSRLPFPVNFRRVGGEVHLDCPYLLGFPGIDSLLQQLERDIVAQFGDQATCHPGKVHWLDAWARTPPARKNVWLELKRVLDPSWAFGNRQVGPRQAPGS